MNLCSRIDFDLAEVLNNRVYADCHDDKYAAEDVEVTWDNYLGVKKYKRGEYIEDGDYMHGKSFFAPTYAEVIDWLFNRGIVIEFLPCFTFALKDNIAYYYNVFRVSKENGGMQKLFKSSYEMSSFELAMRDIVKKLINEKYID